MGLFEDPRLAITTGIGKGTFHIAKQLTLQQRGRQSSTVDRHKRSSGSGAVVMDALREDLFSGPRLAAEQNHRVDRSVALRLGHGTLQRRSLTNDIRKGRFGHMTAINQLMANTTLDILDLL